MNKIDQRVKILVVDDAPSNLVALSAVFYGEKYKLIEANSGYEALALLEVHKDIAVILLDVQMPGMDGFETALKIKQRQDCKEIPIIFITAIYKEDPFVVKGYEAGAIDYFGKPFDPEILKMKVGIYASFREKALLLKEREDRIKETEELLKAGKKLSSILETLPVGVLISDHDGKICQINEEVSRILKSTGIEGDDTYGDLLGWWDNDGLMLKNKAGPMYKALTAGISSHNVILNIKSVDGEPKTIICSASPLRALDKHIVGAVVVIQDKTESRKIEVDLQDRILNLISLGTQFEHEHSIR
ncbi:MAG TPA: response regulator [Bacteriovoracaceae bacterium]|nr:response regulator [Bacteriovoracaceae bacterium]